MLHDVTAVDEGMSGMRTWRRVLCTILCVVLFFMWLFHPFISTIAYMIER